MMTPKKIAGFTKTNEKIEVFTDYPKQREPKEYDIYLNDEYKGTKFIAEKVFTVKLSDEETHTGYSISRVTERTHFYNCLSFPPEVEKAFLIIAVKAGKRVTFKTTEIER